LHNNQACLRKPLYTLTLIIIFTSAASCVAASSYPQRLQSAGRGGAREFAWNVNE
jgi:hypothetical protein